MEWKSVIANSNLIEASTERSVLIKLPKSEFKFWHPQKLCKTSGKNSYRLSISYKDEFEFKMFKTGKGKYNSREKIEEKTMSVAEFETYFHACED